MAIVAKLARGTDLRGPDVPLLWDYCTSDRKNVSAPIDATSNSAIVVPRSSDQGPA
jgi:hypothetical protein